MKTVIRKRWWWIGIIALALALWALSPTWVQISAESLIGRQAPPIRSKTWLNADPIEWSSLRGKVVLVEMWTFG